MYTIVDIETTGNGIHGNRITEIALFNVEEGIITDSFSSLVNPECEIPSFITGLTGITTAMVRQAPLFSDLAPRIEAFTRDRVFVAHSVNFDYPIVKGEFRRCGLEFARRKLCTVRLSRKVFPGLRSYSLGKLCSSLQIPLQDRHRAAGDARATALLFQRIIRMEEGPAIIQKFLNARSQEATLPPHLPGEAYSRLPEAPGIYYFRNRKGEIIYVGKAINLKKRVLGHFYDNSEKELQLCRDTADIDFERSGSDLLALLMEAAAIKKHFPVYNRAQKTIRPAYGLFCFTDRDGIRHLAVNRLRKGQQSVRVFYNQTDARLFLERLCADHGLCARYCHLQEGVSECSHFRVPRCAGVCRGEEPPEAYNQKVTQAMASLSQTFSRLLIPEKGRDPEERAVICIENGVYRGYGFIPRDLSLNSYEDVEAFLVPQPSYPETDRILQSYLVKHPDRVRNLEFT
ncbi:MAG: exonuclease domain-containing protein [Robiginitalea sp.]